MSTNASSLEQQSAEQAAPKEMTSSEKLDALLVQNPLPGWRLVAWPVMILLALSIGWANFATLDEVSIATGEVVPAGRIRVIQHLEGGIIQEIYVTEGDTVREGQTLLQLDLASGGTNQEELQVRIDSERLVKARLEAEATGSELNFPEDVALRRPAIVAAQRQAYEARRRELSSTIQVMREQVKQRVLEVEELTARSRAVKSNYRLALERLKMSKSLLAEGLTAKMEHLELEAEVENLDGEMKSLRPSLPKVEAAVEEARQRQQETESRFRREAQDQLGKIEENIARVTELLSDATAQGIRAEIKSSINGVVKNMRYNSIGNVVKPGEPIMELVPTGDRLVVEAKLNPIDRGYVNEGQAATVKISTYDFARYGGLEGIVIRVAPDSSTDEDGAPYFRVVVQTDKNFLGLREGNLPITPGMQATVDIHTGEKSVMDYLVKPVLKLRHEAFRER
ncbi:HlyD family type I secretion periplasmic adaptor subunit [Rhodospirillales bacterium]|jgi:membrane fusion protein, adhesin transport system|nr:HlyD family type I secretion periplasmic adaptor subunit [Rhodospirillales bacterium]